jgi:hypothetical protein
VPVRLTLLGVGAMNSPRYAPAGLLVEFERCRVMLDGGPGAEPAGALDAWLVTDERAELIGEIRRLADGRGRRADVRRFDDATLSVVPHPVRHTSHPTYGYEITADGRRAAWAPEFFEIPAWAAGVDILFADAAGWERPIRFRGGSGGHAAAIDVCHAAGALGVRRLVLAHIGRPTIRAIDQGQLPPFGEFGKEGAVYLLPTPDV